MDFSRSQIKFIKKNLKILPLSRITESLNIPQIEIEKYLEKKWGKEKLNKFLLKQPLRSEKLPLPDRYWLKKNLKVFILLAFIVAVTYSNSIGNNFVSDDISSLDYIRNLPKSGSYMALVTNFKWLMSYITYKIFGSNPALYRLPNIIFHWGSSATIFLVLSFFFNSPIPFFTSCLFAVHPVLSEAVAWISGGPYSNGSFFTLISFLAYLLYQKKAKNNRFYLLLSLITYIASFFFLRTLFVLPLVLLSYEIILGNFSKNWRQLTPFFLFGGLGFFYLLGLIRERTIQLNERFYLPSGTVNPLLQIPIAITSYLGLIFWPKDLTFYHTELSFTLTQYILRLLIFLIFWGITAFLYKKGKRLFFWSIFFLIFLSPTLTPFKISWIVAERYLYLACLGILAIIAFSLDKLRLFLKNETIFSFIFVFIIFSLATRTIIRNRDWKNEDTLWLATAKTSPSSVQNHNNLGDYYVRQGNQEKAIEEFKTAINLNPLYADPYHNLANVYRQMGRNDLAKENFQKAAFLGPHLWQSHQNLAAIYFKENNFADALKEVKKAIIINPNNSDLFANLGVAYLAMGDYDKAENAFNQSLRLSSDNQVSQAGLREIKKINK